MNAPHDLGFQQFLDRWLRYVAAGCGQWVALVG